MDPTFLEYRQIDRMLVPTRFSERVRGPIRIDAHDWWMTGADMARRWDETAASGPNGHDRTGATEKSRQLHVDASWRPTHPFAHYTGHGGFGVVRKGPLATFDNFVYCAGVP